MMEGWIWTCLCRESPRGRAGLALLLPLLHRPGTQGELGRDLPRGRECGRGAQWAGRHNGLRLTPPGCPLEVPGLSLSPSHLKTSVAPQVSMERGPHYWLTVIIAPQGSNLGSYSPAALPRLGAETLTILTALWTCRPCPRTLAWTSTPALTHAELGCVASSLRSLLHQTLQRRACHWLGCRHLCEAKVDRLSHRPGRRG